MTGQLDLRAAIWAALVAGIVFLVIEILLVATVGGGSPWGPPRMIAAMAMGRGVLPPPATFSAAPVLVAILIHILLSVIYAMMFAWFLSRSKPSFRVSLLLGTLFGLLIYFVNFYGFTAVWPWFAMARNWISIFAHAMFGFVLGWTYHSLASPHWRVVQNAQGANEPNASSSPRG